MKPKLGHIHFYLRIHGNSIAFHLAFPLHVRPLFPFFYWVIMALPSLKMLYYNPKPLLLVMILSHYLLEASQAQLRVGFYSRRCPNAESIVRSVVTEAIASEPNMAAVLLRLHFHDCFVEGCDGSILIDNVGDAERGAFAHQGVGGFEVIETAKTKLEAVCRGVVSCSDIVALAARDAVFLSKGPSYQVPTGRRDGRISNSQIADQDMPDVRDSIELLKSKFMRKGLSEKELVLLSGAHTIGTTACFFMDARLYDFSGRNDSDPAINPTFLPTLQNKCPRGGDVNVRLPLDPVSGQVFDIQLLRNIKNGFAVIESDARLNDDVKTREALDFYAGTHSSLFGRDFAKTMVKMGGIGVKTGSQGDIRLVCRAFN